MMLTAFSIIALFSLYANGEMFYITTPNGHTVWKEGQPVKIAWQIIPGGPAVRSINLDLMSGPDGNATSLINIATGLSRDSTSFDWTVPTQGINNCLVSAEWVNSMMRQSGPTEWILPDEAWGKIVANFPHHQLAFIKLTGVTDSFQSYVYNFSHRLVIKDGPPQNNRQNNKTTAISNSSSNNNNNVSATKISGNTVIISTNGAGSVVTIAATSNNSNKGCWLLRPIALVRKIITKILHLKCPPFLPLPLLLLPRLLQPVRPIVRVMLNWISVPSSLQLLL